MKPQVILFIIATFITTAAFSQVAINSTGAQPDASAIVDISSSDKGLLIPKMHITDVDSDLTPVNSPAEGLLVYNTGGTAGIPEGFYYWDGVSWKLITNDSSLINNNQVSELYETAELYANNPISTPEVINLPLSTNFYGWTTALEGETFGDTYTDLTNATADQIIVGETGLYEIEISASFGGSNNAQILASVFHTPSGGSATETRVGFLRKLSSSGDLGSATTHGLLNLSARDAVDLRFTSTTDGEVINLYRLNFIVNKVAN